MRDQCLLGRLPSRSALLLFSFLFMAPGVAMAQSGSQKAPAQSQDALQIHRQYKPVVGQPHLDFILPSIDGGLSIQLSQYRGQKVLLLHFASW